MFKKLISLFICLLFLLPLLSPLIGKAVEEAVPFEEVRYRLRTRNASPLIGTSTSLYLDFSSETVADIDSVRYEWYHDGEILPNVKGTKLSLKSAKAEDAGDYTVRVTLQEGEQTKIIECGPLSLRVFRMTELLGWGLIGLLFFALPTAVLFTLHLVRHAKKKKENS